MRFVVRVHDAVVALKRLVRTGWRQRGVPEPESVAAHSYGVALLVLLLAEERRDRGEAIDVEAAVRMALLHDLPEADTGDLTPAQRTALFGDDRGAARSAQRAAERRALVALLEGASTAVRARWTAAWEDYREGRSAEAALVAEADALDCVLQALAYRREARGDGLTEFGRLVAELREPGLAEALAARWDAEDALTRGPVAPPGVSTGAAVEPPEGRGV